MPAQQATSVPDVVEYQSKWTDSVNRGDVSGMDEAFAPECVIHITGSPVPNLDLAGFKQMLSAMLTAFPDLHFTIEDHINAGERVATRWVAEGTNTGPFAGARPTGKPIRVGGSSSIAFSTAGWPNAGSSGTSPRCCASLASRNRGCRRASALPGRDEKGLGVAAKPLSHRPNASGLQLFGGGPSELLMSR